MNQEPGEAKEFNSSFERILSDLHPGYRRNTRIRGVRTEFLREIEGGVYASQNVYCKRGTYYHCFCLTLDPEAPNPYMLSPFTIGGRFDHNHTIQRAVSEVLGRHTLLSDSHNFRIGWQDISAKCSKQAELVLTDHYLSIFRDTKSSLLELINLLDCLDNIPDPDFTPHGSGYHIGNLDCDMAAFNEMYNVASDKKEFLMSIVASKPELFQRIKKKDEVRLSNN